MSFASKTRQSSIITLVVLLFLLTTAVFAFAEDGTPTTDTTATDSTVAVSDVADTTVAQEDEVTEAVAESTLVTETTAVLDSAVSAMAGAGGPLKGCEQAAPGPGGPYDSTCDGSPSGNGNGGGGAGGKPCAGCVGSADDKNPKGQLPGPQDHNNGYECDGNNGIAKTNPAHTGCAATTTTVPVTTTTLPCEATTTTVGQCGTTTTAAVTTTTLPCEATTTTVGECESTTTTTTPISPKHTICHATGSESNPFVIIGPSPVGVIYGHLGVSHQDGRDIVPPFDYDANDNGMIDSNEHFQQNWDAEHQAIFYNGCEVPLGTTIVNTTTTTAQVTTTTGEVPTTTTDEVLPTLITQVGGLGQPHPSRILPRRNPPSPDVLPFTGSDPSGFIGMAGVLMALGGSVMLAADRKRRLAEYYS
jgi:hypothetical protein